MYQNIENKQTADLSSDIITKFFHGLSNSTRLKIVLLLLTGKKSVSEIVEETGIKQSQISNQLACLKWCGYVSAQKEGKFIYYQITDERVRQMIRLAHEIVADNAEQIGSCTRI